MPILRYEEDDTTAYDYGSMPGLAAKILEPQTQAEKDAAIAALEEPPGFASALGPAFRRQNLVGSALASETGGLNPYDKDEGFDPFSLDKGTRWDSGEYDEERAEIFNRRYYDAWKAQKIREEEDKKSIEASGWAGTGAEVVASIVDPTILIGGPALKGGSTIVRTMKTFALAGTAGAVVSEAGLQATQLDRDVSETVLNVGAGALFSTFVGAGVGAWMTRAERRAVGEALAGMRDAARNPPTQAAADVAETQALAQVRDGTGPTRLTDEELAVRAQEIASGIQSTDGGGSIGAASVRRLDPSAEPEVERIVVQDAEDLELAGPGVGTMAQTWGWNPILRLARSTSVRARQIGAELLENGAYTRMNMNGETIGPAVESILARHSGREVVTVEEHQKIWKTMRKDASSEKLTRTEFNERVAAAMRRNDKDPAGNAYVERAARNYRETLLSPMRDEALQVGVLTREQVDAALPGGSYLPRFWSASKIREKEAGFRSMMGEYVRSEVNKAVVKATETKDARITRLREEIDRIRATPEERAAKLQSIGEALRDVRDRGEMRFGPVDEEIAGLRRDISRARDEGDSAGQTTAEERIAALRAEAGADYADYKRAIRKLEAARRRYATGTIEGAKEGMTARFAKIAEIADGNMSRLQRLSKSLARLEENAARLSPERFDQEIVQLQGKLDDILEQSRKASERFAEMNAKDGDRAMATSRPEPEGRTFTPDMAADLRDRIGEAIEGMPGSRLDGEDTGVAFPDELMSIARNELGWTDDALPTREQLDKRIRRRLAKGRPPLPSWLTKRVDELTERRPADPQNKMRTRPVLTWLKDQGGVRPDSPLAGNLRAAGFDTRNSPGLFRKGGRGALDNLVREESDLFRDFPDDGSGYISEDAIVQALRDEYSGSPLRTVDEQARIDAYDERIGWFEGMEREFEEITGVSPQGKDADEILADLEAEGMDWDRIGAIYESSRVAEEFPEEVAARDATDPVAASETRAQLEAQRRMVVRQAIYEAAERKRVEKAARLNERLATAREIDPGQRLAQVRSLIDSRTRHTAELLHRESERIGNIVREMKTGSPEVMAARASQLEQRIGAIEADYQTRIGEGYDAQGGYDGYVTQIVDDLYDKLAGVKGADIPDDLVSEVRGSLKDRTLHIADTYEAGGYRVEDFIENDIEHVGERMSRQMGADIELSRKFGSASMRERIGEVVAEYQQARNAIDRSSTLTAEQKVAQNDRLRKEEKQVLIDIAAMRDIARGSYMSNLQNTNVARTVRAGMTYSYITSLGGVSTSSLTDIVQPMMRHGFSRYFGDGIRPLIANSRVIKMRKLEAKRAGTLVDLVKNGRLSTLADINNPHAYGTAFERFVNNAGNVFSKATLLNHWNYFQKSIASSITQARIADNLAKPFDQLAKGEQRYMAYLGIGDEMSERIKAQVGQWGESYDGATITNTHLWNDPDAVNAFLAAVKKDTDVTIITKSIGDVPLWMHHPLYKMVGQFQSFAMASNQRLLMRGLAEGAQGSGAIGRNVAGAGAMVMMGMLVYALKKWERGEQPSDNPGTWLAEGVDRSGLISFPLVFNNTAEKIGLPGMFTAFGAAGAAATGAEAIPRSSRYQQKNFVSAMAGPLFGKIQDIANLASGASGEVTSALGLTDPNESGFDKTAIKSVRNLTPFLTLLGVKSFVDGYLVPAAEQAVD